MQNNTDNYIRPEDADKCILIMKQETEILGNINHLQDALRRAVMQREWTDFEAMLSAINAYNNDFEALEYERVRVFSSFSDNPEENNPGSGFYTLISRLPEDLRKEISELYRCLKVEILKIRLSNDSLMQYLAEAKTTISSFLEAAFPDRKGRLYSRRGTHLPPDMRSMVLNRQF
ncbi:hypothetical protein LJC14_01620 [Treponema sp. OttesenSCG-928-L16]|nr:hypothetical protein [Treponema sp. OttesenSCG-928-L16]